MCAVGVFLEEMRENTLERRLCRCENANTGQGTNPPVGDVNTTSPTTRPVYVRLPKSGERCAITGLSRGTLNDLILGADAPVKSVMVARPGATRGVRLVCLESLLNHLDEEMAAQIKYKTAKGNIA